jgi:hypothetical protein
MFKDRIRVVFETIDLIKTKIGGRRVQSSRFHDISDIALSLIGP